MDKKFVFVNRVLTFCVLGLFVGLFVGSYLQTFAYDLWLKNLLFFVGLFIPFILGVIYGFIKFFLPFYRGVRFD